MMKKLSRLVVIIVILAVALYIGAWLWLLGSNEPLNHPFAQWKVWPVACSTRGCVTSAEWLHQHELGLAFARASNQDLPIPTESLTTGVRRHLVRNAFLRSPITLVDARRYREDILNSIHSTALEETLGIDVDAYDKEIILPFLQQEALREELKVESVEELYRTLSDERSIVVLPFGMSWDGEMGEVISR